MAPDAAVCAGCSEEGRPDLAYRVVSLNCTCRCPRGLQPWQAPIRSASVPRLVFRGSKNTCVCHPMPQKWSKNGKDRRSPGIVAPAKLERFIKGTAFGSSLASICDWCRGGASELPDRIVANGCPAMNLHNKSAGCAWGHGECSTYMYTCTCTCTGMDWVACKCVHSSTVSCSSGSGTCFRCSSRARSRTRTCSTAAASSPDRPCAASRP